MHLRVQKGKKKNDILPVFICMLLSFIAITISCKNSFLYDFNDSFDVQTFVTTARCMLRGDVLYRDVFDVKGPLLYFFYMLGLLIDSSTFRGIFVLESILFMIFSILCYFIAGIYVENKALRVAVAGITSFVSTTSYSFMGGGQCEELVLPVLALTVYIVLKYFRQDYPKRIEWYCVTLIGLCTAVIVWVKYTLAGLFLGVVLYVLYLQIKEKNWKYIWRYAGEFLMGFVIGSIPTLIYFGTHNAFDSLFEVYFYDLIFSYKEPGDSPTHFLTNNFYLYYIGASALTAFAFVYPVLDGGRHLKKQERQIISLMVFFMGVGLSFGKYWRYTAECMQVFAPLGAIGVIFTVMDCSRHAAELLDKCTSVVEKMLLMDWTRKKYYPAMVVGVLLLLNTDIFVVPVVVIVGAILLTCLLQKYLTPLIQKKPKLLLIKYLILFVIYYGCTMWMATTVSAILGDGDDAIAFKYFWRLTVLLSALADWRFFVNEFSKSVINMMHQWKTEYVASRKKINALAGILVLVLYTFYCYSLSKSSYDIGSSVEDKPQYMVVNYIRNSGKDNPVVIYYEYIDFGYYWLSQTYPETRFSGGFNINLPEISKVYEEYVDEGRADFVITSRRGESFELPGYFKVYEGQYHYVDTAHTMNVVLWEKSEE